MGSLQQSSILKGLQVDITPRHLHRIFEEKIKSCCDKIALHYIRDVHKMPEIVSYSALNEKANQIARTIIENAKNKNLKPNNDGDWIVAVCMNPSEKLITILLSIWKAGAAYLPLDPSFPTNRIQHILNESKPILVISDDSVDKNMFLAPTTTISVTEIYEQSKNSKNCDISCTETLQPEGDLALVLYTSGSTGIPKGVRLPHAIILNRLQWQWERFPYSNSESYGIFKTALTFVDSISEIWGPLLNEMTIVIIPKDITKDPERLVTILEKFEIERLVLVPTLLRTLLMYLSMNNNNNKKLLTNLKSWICSGEPLSITLAKEFYEYFEEGKQFLFNFYGSTEVMGDVTYFICEGVKQLESLERIPIGYPINNTVIYLLDSEQKIVKPGEIGEIFVSGLNLADGYVNGRDPDRFIKNPFAIDSNHSRIYRTGDYGSIYKGVIMYEGRTDSQIKIRGHRVDLSEVEKYLNNVDAIEKAVVLCYHAGNIDQSLLAFVTLKENEKNCTESEIELILQNKLPAYMVPQVIIFDAIPLLVNGKVDRQHLLKSYEALNSGDDDKHNLDIDYSNVPENLMETAKDLFEIVREIVGKSSRGTISMSSNFYELGGNSLNSIYTVAQLREKDYYISISEFISSQSMGEILEKLSKFANTLDINSINDKSSLKLHASPLTAADKDNAINIITASFYEKADLEQWFKDDITHKDYSNHLNLIYEALLENDCSFIVRDEKEKIMGVALNMDARDEPDIEVTSKLIIAFDFLEYLEGPIRETYLPKGKNQILHSFMMGTNQELNAQQNIEVINFMEQETIDVARRKKYTGIFTTNTSALTQQLATIYNYKAMLEYQVNEYIYKDGTKPFGDAPDSQKAIVYWKEIMSTN